MAARKNKKSIGMRDFEEAVERAQTVVEEKNPDLPAKQKADIAKAVGIGAVMMGGQLQMDLAGDFSDRTDNVVLSAIYRF